MKEIETIKKMVADGVLTQEIADKYFPELKEDKDERIREYLIKYVNENMFVKPFNADGVDKQTILAWLEKQGEQKHIPWYDATKAKERALERCPKSNDLIEEQRNERKRCIFIEGYNQAEKDLKAELKHSLHILIAETCDYVTLCLGLESNKTEELREQMLKIKDELAEQKYNARDTIQRKEEINHASI